MRPLLMAFFTGEEISEKKGDEERAGLTVTAVFSDEGAEVTLAETTGFFGLRPQNDSQKGDNSGRIQTTIPGNPADKEHYRNTFKLAFYRLLCNYTGRNLPWGDLTGVRPTKIAMQLLIAGKSEEEIIAHYVTTYDASREKAALATRVAQTERTLLRSLASPPDNQTNQPVILSEATQTMHEGAWCRPGEGLRSNRKDPGIVDREETTEKDYCLYIGIPFCKSRCLYCSFTSYPIAKYKKCAADYVEKLIAEIKVIARKNKERNLVAIYIGGGTPASLSEELTERLMCGIEEAYPELPSEYTVEAGRADCITLAKLKSYMNHGVNRVSINPQTMNNETLVTIGRAHTAEQVVEAFHLAREAGFTNINMDLIAGLPGEDVKAMEHTLSEIEKLAPESLTVHSLALKRAANLNKEFEAYGGSIHHDMEAQLDLVERSASRMGLEPYYLYRQKNIGGNLENVGYAKPGCACLYNILIMEELVDIMGAGAGAATKLHRKVERIANPKQVEDYFARYDDIIERKENMTWQ